MGQVDIIPPREIVIVEDDPDNLDFAQLWLDKLFPGAKRHPASNGIQGVKLAKKEEVDLVLTDVRMPGKDGATMIRELGPAIQASLFRKRIVAITGNVEGHADELMNLLRSYLLRAIIKKPYELDEIRPFLSLLFQPGNEGKAEEICRLITEKSLLTLQTMPNDLDAIWAKRGKIIQQLQNHHA